MRDDSKDALLANADGKEDDGDSLDVTDHPTPFNDKPEEVIQGKTLFIFGPDSKLRRLLFSIVSSRLFDIINSFFVLISCISIVVEKSGAKFIVENKAKSAELFFGLDLFFFILFFLEGLAKVIVYGFVRRKNAYLRNLWNWVDMAAIFVRKSITFTPTSPFSFNFSTLQEKTLPQKKKKNLLSRIRFFVSNSQE